MNKKRIKNTDGIFKSFVTEESLVKIKSTLIPHKGISLWTPKKVKDMWVCDNAVGQQVIDIFYPLRDKMYLSLGIDVFLYRSKAGKESNIGNPCVILLFYLLVQSYGYHYNDGGVINYKKIRQDALNALRSSDNIYNTAKGGTDMFGNAQDSMISELVTMMIHCEFIVKNPLNKGEHIFFLCGVPYYYKHANTSASIVANVSFARDHKIIHDIKRIPKHLLYIIQEPLKIEMDKRIETAMKYYGSNIFKKRIPRFTINDIFAVNNLGDDGTEKIDITANAYFELVKDFDRSVLEKRTKVEKKKKFNQYLDFRRYDALGDFLCELNDAYKITGVQLLILLSLHYFSFESVALIYARLRNGKEDISHDELLDASATIKKIQLNAYQKLDDLTKNMDILKKLMKSEEK